MLYTQFDFNCAFGLVVARGRAAISDDDFTVSYPCRKVNVSSGMQLFSRGIDDRREAW